MAEMLPELLPWQTSQWRILAEAIAHRRLPHAMLLRGASGLGKAQFASRLANALVCRQPGENLQPCGACRSCQLAAAGTHPDIRWIEPEEAGKPIRIDSIRSLAEASVLTAQERGYRLFIINPAQAMNTAASNALLKTLEEPVERTLLLLISDQPQKLSATIRSRCQAIDFFAPGREMARDWLATQSTALAANADVLLDLVSGAPFKALLAAEEGWLEQYGGHLEQFIAVAAGKADPLSVAAEWSQRDFLQLSWFILTWLNDLLQLRMGNTHARLYHPRQRHRLQSTAQTIDLRGIYRLLDTVYDLRRQSANNLNNQLALERLLIDWSWAGGSGVRN